MTLLAVVTRPRASGDNRQGALHHGRQLFGPRHKSVRLRMEHLLLEHDRSAAAAKALPATMDLRIHQRNVPARAQISVGCGIVPARSESGDTRRAPSHSSRAPANRDRDHSWPSGRRLAAAVQRVLASTRASAMTASVQGTRRRRRQERALSRTAHGSYSASARGETPAASCEERRAQLGESAGKTQCLALSPRAQQ
eukprot:4428433-Pleurochrysis_carterae.AAC.3